MIDAISPDLVRTSGPTPAPNQIRVSAKTLTHPAPAKGPQSELTTRNEFTLNLNDGYIVLSVIDAQTQTPLRHLTFTTPTGYGNQYQDYHGQLLDALV